MLTSYFTDRLCLQILDGSNAAKVLTFYNENKELFEKYEAARPEGFYSVAYHQASLNYEYNSALAGKDVRFWVFLDNDPNKIIGTVSFQHFRKLGYSECQIGYKFHEKYQHKGYATEAIKASCQIIFSEYKIHRIEANTMISNEASIKLLERCGFEREALLKEKAYINGAFRDYYLYALINP